MQNFKFFIFGVLTGVIVLGLYFFAYKDSPFVKKSDIEKYLKQVKTTPVNITNNQSITVSRKNAITNAVELVSPAVVGINVVKLKKQVVRSPFAEDRVFRQFFPPRYVDKRVKGVGSGFIYTPDGYIITNEHVIHGATEIIVTTTDGKEHATEIVGADQIADIAVLKIDVDNHPYADIGDSDDIVIGEWVIAFGNPYGLFEYNNRPLITVGVVSGIDINFGKSSDGKHFYENMIQTDASINPGNSGGPLVNAEGQVIGLNTMIYSEAGGGSIGIGFDIPINKVKKIRDILIEHGYVNRSINWGFRLANADNTKVDGVLVIDLLEDGPAKRDGFLLGDIIVAVDNLKIDNANDIKNALLEARDYKVGDRIKFIVYRDGELKPIHMTLEAYK